ncbi:26S proteasome regulatory subunit, partial [Cladochytrium tenue]
MDVDGRDPTAYLRKLRGEAPAELHENLAKMEELYDRKLWHQLTGVLASFVDAPAAAPYLVPLYREFVADFVKRVNQLSVVQYATKAARTIKDPKESLAFLQAQADRLEGAADEREAL